MTRQPPDLSRRLAVTVPEAALVLGVSERHIRSLLPELPHVHLGGRVVIPVEPLREWLRQRVQIEQSAVDGASQEILESLEGR